MMMTKTTAMKRRFLQRSSTVCLSTAWRCWCHQPVGHSRRPCVTCGCSAYVEPFATTDQGHLTIDYSDEVSPFPSVRNVALCLLIFRNCQCKPPNTVMSFHPYVYLHLVFSSNN